MARRLKARYVDLVYVTPVVTERGMALSARDEDGRDFYVLASPKMLICLAKSLIRMTVHSWFRQKYNADTSRFRDIPETLSDPTVTAA
jgi:hypothetical protein